MKSTSTGTKKLIEIFAIDTKTSFNENDKNSIRTSFYKFVNHLCTKILQLILGFNFLDFLKIYFENVTERHLWTKKIHSYFCLE